MASRPLRRNRFKILDEMGLDEICEIYCEKADGVRHLMTLVFEPAHEGRKPGASDFYAWLDARGYRDEWSRTVEIKPLTGRGHVYSYAYEPESLDDEDEDLRDPG